MKCRLHFMGGLITDNLSNQLTLERTFEALTYISVIFAVLIIMLPIILNTNNFLNFINNKKTIITLFVELLLLIILLFTCNLCTGGKWFISTALPIFLFFAFFVWVIALFIRYNSCNIFIKGSYIFFISTIITYITNSFIDFIVNKKSFQLLIPFNLNNWNEKYMGNNIIVLTTIIFAILTVVCFLIGNINSISKH